VSGGQSAEVTHCGVTHNKLMHTKPALHCALFVHGCGVAGGGRGSHFPFVQSFSGGH
jgi:hypothetical protein